MSYNERHIIIVRFFVFSMDSCKQARGVNPLPTQAMQGIHLLARMTQGSSEGNRSHP